MFERTRSFLRHLAQGGVRHAEDRRTHPRFPSDVRVACRTVSGGQEFSASIVNVSRSGVNLIIDREIEDGTMLRIELPEPIGESTHTTLLACIMNGRPAENGWSYGCMFSQELTEDEIGKFGGQKTRTTGTDKRAWVRYKSSAKAEYRILPDREGPLHSCDVADLSPCGVGLIVQEPLEAGAVLNLTLHGHGKHENFTILACVVYVSDRSDGSWAAGCNFIRELSHAELKDLT